MLKICPHCKIENNYKNAQQFGAHITNCDKNPNSKERITNIKKSLNKIEKNKKYKYEIKCKQCDSDIVFETTKHKFEIGKYSKFCSSFCSSQYSSLFNKSDDLKSSECISCGKSIKINKRASSNNSKCEDCKKLKKCKCCNNFNCKDERCYKFLRGRKKIFKKLGFNFYHFGDIKFYTEYDRICELLKTEYENQSMVEIGEKYDINYQTIWTLMKDLKIKARDTSESLRMAFTKGRIQLPEVEIFPYKSGYHTTWLGDKIWYRSSYELNYCNKLDEEKINYKVESLRIEYWDSQSKKVRTAIPDFLLPDTNTIVEIKSSYTYDPVNMKDKFKSYIKNGYKCKLILDGETINIKNKK